MSRLKIAKSIATIFAAVAVPVVVALVGWQIQSSVSRESVRKDYVQMAIGILSNPNGTEDKALRQWAISVLDKNSPVPFTSEARADLARGTVFIQPKVFQPILASPMMAPPKPWVDPPKNYSLDELIENYTENMRRGQHNYHGLKHLQDVIRLGAQAELESSGPDPSREPAQEPK